MTTDTTPATDRLIIDHLPEPDTVPELTTLLRDVYDSAYTAGYSDGLAETAKNSETTHLADHPAKPSRESSLPYPHRNRREREAKALVEQITAGRDSVFTIQTDQLINIAHRLGYFPDLHDGTFHDWSVAFKAHLHRRKFKVGNLYWKPILKVTGTWWIERA
jgi:hypothetical protein